MRWPIVLLVGAVAGSILWLLADTGSESTADIDVVTEGRGDSDAFVAPAALDPHDRQAAEGLRPASPEELDEWTSKPWGELGFVGVGSLQVTLRNQDGIAISPGRIKVTSPWGGAQSALVDARGEVVFEGLDVGRWRLTIDPDSLPEGYLAPWNQLGSGCAADLPPGLIATEVEITEGKTTATSFVVNSPARVTVFVEGPDGGVIPNATVRLRTFMPCIEGYLVDAVTDDNGRALLDDLHPGAHYLEVWPAQPAHLYLSRPEGFIVEVHPGFDHGPFTLRLGIGDVTIEGTVVDRFGEPVAGLTVEALYYKPESERHPWRAYSRYAGVASLALTDANGRYVFDDLPRERIHVAFTRSFSPAARVGSKRFAGGVDNLEFDLKRTSATVDAGITTVWFSRPYTLRGRVFDVDGRPRTSGAVWVSLGSDEGAGLPSGLHMPGFERYGQKFARLEDDGSFSWACETPHVPVILRIGKAHYTVTPQPDTEEELTFEWR